MRSPGLCALSGAACAVLLPATVLAEPVSPLGAGQLLQVFAGLGVVLVLIALAAWATRRLNNVRPQGTGRIRIIEGLSVGAREKLLLVEVDEHRVLLAMCPGRIETLHAFGAGAVPSSFDDALAQVTATDRDAAA